MRPSQNLTFPPRLYPTFQQLYATLPESTAPSQNIPPPPVFLTTICDPRRIYPSLPEYTPFSTTIISCGPLRIYPSLLEYTLLFNNAMRRSQNRPLLPKIYLPFSRTICDPPRIDPSLPEYTPFSTTILLCAFPESTPASRNPPPFSRTKEKICDPPKICPSLPEYFSVLGASGRFSHIYM